MEKENELQNIEKEMKEIKGRGGNLANFDFEGVNESYIQSMSELKEKLEEKKSKK